MIIDEGTAFVCEKKGLVVSSYIRDSKGRTGSILLDNEGNFIVLQCVDYLMYKPEGIFKSITIELIDYAVANNCRFFLYVKKTEQVWELDAKRIKNECEQEKRYFRGINMYYLNLKGYFIKNPLKDKQLEVSSPHREQ